MPDLTAAVPANAQARANARWGCVLAETLARLGLTTAVVSPGSRSTPLAVALAMHGAIEAIPVLDERSAAFFALGIAKRSHRPVALLCTSGTAAANYLPAIVEAHESGVPLIVLTADRPPELRACNAGQAIDQTKLYGTFVNAFVELAIPGPDTAPYEYLRQTLLGLWESSLGPRPGPVHANVPMREPLVSDDAQDGPAFVRALGDRGFFANLDLVESGAASLDAPIAEMRAHERGVIVVGHTEPADPGAFALDVARISAALGWPVLADALTPLRQRASLVPLLVGAYPAIVRNPALAAELAPAAMLRIGGMPTSKALRAWLASCDPIAWQLDPAAQNLDPLHLRTARVRGSVAALARACAAHAGRETSYAARWRSLERDARERLARTLAADDVSEAAIAWAVREATPAPGAIVVANSTPVRDCETAWISGDRDLDVYVNRGANGIDGTLSTALGVAHGGRPTTLLTGDLAFLHDAGGAAISVELRGTLTVVLVDNDGGGIFEHLAIAAIDPPFERFFATPQRVAFASLCAAYGLAYERVEGVRALSHALAQPPRAGVRVLHVRTDRRANVALRAALVAEVAAALA